jgi:hypothetical protein
LKVAPHRQFRGRVGNQELSVFKSQCPKLILRES